MTVEFVNLFCSTTTCKDNHLSIFEHTHGYIFEDKTTRLEHLIETLSVEYSLYEYLFIVFEYSL